MTSLTVLNIGHQIQTICVSLALGGKGKEAVHSALLNEAAGISGFALL